MRRHARHAYEFQARVAQYAPEVDSSRKGKLQRLITGYINVLRGIAGVAMPRSFTSAP
jgi:hypothetical protein